MCRVYEVELKARIKDIENLQSKLNVLSTSTEVAIYEETYFNNEHNLVAQEKELRLRLIHKNATKSVALTYKDPPFDSTSKSKPEIEVSISDYQDALKLFTNLGFIIDIQFQKHCLIYRFDWHGLAIALTIADVPELGAIFVEIETLVAAKKDTPEAFKKLYALMTDLDIPKSAITNEYYSDAIRSSRITTGE